MDWNEGIANAGNAIAQTILRNKALAQQEENKTAVKGMFNKFLTNPNDTQALSDIASNPEAAQNLNPIIQMMNMNKAGAEEYSLGMKRFRQPTKGGVPIGTPEMVAENNYQPTDKSINPYEDFRNNPKYKDNPSLAAEDWQKLQVQGKIDVSNARQSTIGKTFSELNAIKQQNPNDPRVGAYEKYLEKLSNPTPLRDRYTLVQTANGYVPFNTTKGQVGEPTGLGKPLTGEMITQESQLSELKSSLNRVQALYNPSYVGAVAGRLSKIEENFTDLPTDQAAFYSNLADINNTLIYLKSGKQINETEYQRLVQQLPERDLPENVFQTRMQEFQRVVNEIENSRAKNKGGYGGQVAPKTQPKQDNGLNIDLNDFEAWKAKKKGGK